MIKAVAMQQKLMMKLVVGSEAVFFLSLLIAYLYFWRSGHFGAAVAAHLHPRTTSVFTVLLLASSFTFYRAERSLRRDNEKGLKAWLSATLLLGAVFLAGQAREYYHLIGEDLTIGKSEFGSSFYTLTGFHGLHVLIGLLLLSVLLALARKGFFRKPSSLLGSIGIYWHFVDVVWLFVFTTVYLLPYLL